MKKMVLGLMCLCILPVSLFADMSKAELQQMYLDYLRSQNISAEIEEEYGDIVFRYGERQMTCFIEIQENYPQVFRITWGDYFSIKTPADMATMPHAACYATGRAAYAKVYLDTKDNIIREGDKIKASAEVYLVSPGDFKDVFYELMGGIEYALEQFATLMK